MDSDEILKPLAVFALIVAGAAVALGVVGFALGAGAPSLDSDGSDIAGQSPGQYQPSNLETQFASEGESVTVDGPDDGNRSVLVDTLHENRLSGDAAAIVQRALFEAGHSTDLDPRSAGANESNVGPRRPGGTTGTATATSLTEVSLERYNGILIVQPEAGFSSEERTAIREYVEDGGHVVIMAEPTRTVPEGFSATRVEFGATDLLRQFGMRLGTQTLFNLDSSRNDNNYKSIYATPASENGSGLTEGVERVTFDIATSVTVRDGSQPVYRALEGTTKIDTRRSGRFPTVARSAGGNVVVVADTSILERSEVSDADNEVFIGNVLEFLAAGSPS